MKNRTLLAVLLLFSLFCVGFIYRQNRPQFEYKFDYKPSEKKANELGVQGWELIAVEAPSQYSNVPTYVFKRAK